MKFIAIEKLGFNQLIQTARQLGIKVKGRLDFAKTWVNAIRRELIKRALQVGKRLPSVAVVKKQTIAATIASINWLIDRATSQRAKLLYKHLGVLVATIWAIVWLVVSVLWETIGEVAACSRRSLDDIVAPSVERCLEPVEVKVVRPPTDEKPVSSIKVAAVKARRNISRAWQSGTQEAASLFGMVQRCLKSWRFRQHALTAAGSVGVVLLGNLVQFHFY